MISATMLLSSTGIRISQHWCGDVLVNTSIWGNAKPCEHFQSNTIPCPFHPNMFIEVMDGEKKNCCNEQAIYVKGGDEDFMPYASVVSAPVWNLLALIPSFDLDLFRVAPKREKFRNHSPPLLTRPILLLVQSFLI